MNQKNIYVFVFTAVAIAISMLDMYEAQYLDEIEEDPIEGLFAEAVLQNHLNEKVRWYIVYVKLLFRYFNMRF